MEIQVKRMKLEASGFDVAKHLLESASCVPRQRRRCSFPHVSASKLVMGEVFHYSPPFLPIMQNDLSANWLRCPRTVIVGDCRASYMKPHGHLLINAFASKNLHAYLFRRNPIEDTCRSCIPSVPASGRICSGCPQPRCGALSLQRNGCAGRQRSIHTAAGERKYSQHNVHEARRW